ncbi:flagellar biosynthesis anti-sigma factor FlgM [uncultured Sphingomonas sp.]|uniref:flagellar biosynthesis anti-sigma factor FlgM n=1 Tax=uncultured Sphingomonas sp. TaxID=158754 RepID=UPI0035C9C178
MVDSVGAKPFIVGGGVLRIDRAPAPRAIETAKPAVAPAPVAGLRGIARELASGPPVDADRVSRIRQAIANDTFPILPATIADRLLAYKMNWNGNEQA